MAPRKNAGSVFMPTKVKRLMQADKEVGKMVAEVPILMACAVEMLLSDILRAANAIRTQGTTKLLTAAHLEQVMNQNQEYVAVRPPVTGSIALHPHEFIAKYSKQSYMMQQKPPGMYGLDPNSAMRQQPSQLQSSLQAQPQQQVAYGTVVGSVNPMISGTQVMPGGMVGLMIPGPGVPGQPMGVGAMGKGMMMSNDSDEEASDSEEEDDEEDDE